jgi:hypothetical protein
MAGIGSSSCRIVCSGSSYLETVMEKPLHVLQSQIAGIICAIRNGEAAFAFLTESFLGDSSLDLA